MKILISGLQGSGKTTQAKIISQKLNICLVKIGDIIRERAKVDDSVGRELTLVMDKGGFVDNEVAGQLLKEKLATAECQENFLVDGYPRNLKQLKVFDPEFGKVINLKLSDEEAKKRLLARGREDDTPQAIDERLKLYHQETEKVLDYYRQQNLVIDIDASQPIQKVNEDILRSCYG